MMTPYPLSSSTRIGGDTNFEAWEFSGWEIAEPEEVGRLEALVTGPGRLQAARDRFGRIDISRGGWILSRHGGRRGGCHERGHAVDFVPAEADTFDVYAWIRDNGTYGELIYEPPSPKNGPRGHVHMTLPGCGGRMEALLETEEGVYVADPDAPGPDPMFSLPGIVATVRRRTPWLWLGGLLLVGSLRRSR